MQVHIDVEQAQAAVYNIQHMARRVADKCGHMLEKVKFISGGMQTEMGDSVRKEAVKVERNLSHLRDEMQALDTYMRELAEYIEKYGRCAYNGIGSLTYANVDTDDLVQYSHNADEFVQDVGGFRSTAEETAARNVELLERGAGRLERKIGECNTTLRYLKDKVLRAQAKIKELQSKLRQLQTQLKSLKEQIRHYQALAAKARANAAAVVIPSYRSRTVTNSDGSTHTEDNSTEIAAARERKAQYLREAEEYERKAARLIQEANRVEQEIRAVETELTQVINLLNNMLVTKAELEAHINEMSSSRQLLRDSLNDIQRVLTTYRENCCSMQEKGDHASSKLHDAEHALGGYAESGLQQPHLESVFDTILEIFT